MDDNKNIAISRIADILSGNKLIIPQIDIWKKIFYNVGLSDIYDTYKSKLTVRHEQINWQDMYYHNDKCFSALLEIFLELAGDFGLFIKLINAILEKVNQYNIFDEKIDKYLKHSHKFGAFFDIVEYIMELKSHEQKNEILLKYPSEEFLYLRNNLNMLGLDVIIESKFNLVVRPFTYLSKQVNEETTLIREWLYVNYPNVFISYEAAIKAYGSGDGVGCLIHCRNSITGFFTYKKYEQTEWVKGLQESCKKDKNISNIASPKIIPNINYNPHDLDINKRYRYPRFNIIYKVYSYLCSLGAHVNEGNKVEDTVDAEDTDMSDAFMGMRMTEDILIWLYQNEIEI